MNEYAETVHTSDDGRRRVVILPDEYADQPYDDGGPHVFHVEARYGWYAPSVTLQHTSYGRDSEAKVLESALSEAFARWGHDGDMILRYLRMFHDVVSFDYVSSTVHQGDGTLYGITTRGLAEAWGIDPDGEAARQSATSSHGLAEWQAWLDGDVWLVASQRLITWTSERGDTVDQWESVDIVGGYYGHEWAVEAAGEAYAELPAARA